LGESYLGFNPSVLIVTMKSTEDIRADLKLLPFVGDDHSAGHGDILIVKQMGGVGLDCARLKVMLDLSSVRTVSSVVQRLTRIATPFEGINIGHVITAEDPLMRIIWERFVVSEGGELTESSFWVPECPVGDPRLKPKPEEEFFDPRFGDSVLAGYDDSHGNIGPLGLYEYVCQLERSFPILTAHYTKAELATRAKGLPFLNAEQAENVGRDHVHRSLDTDIQTLRDQLNDIADKIASKRMWKRTPVYDGAIYQEEIIPVWVNAYRAVGVPKGTNLKIITNLNTLTRLLEVLKKELDSLWS
jgi:hypothetical protein